MGKPQDLVVSAGLHSVVLYYYQTAIAIANSPEINLDDANSEFRVYWDSLVKYMRGDSGMEFGLGLIKSILVYQHEALSQMRNNTDVTITEFGVILLILVLQCLFLCHRIGAVTRDSCGMLVAITRFVDEIQELSNSSKKVHEKENKTAYTKKALEVDNATDSADASEDDASDLDENLPS